MTMIDEEARAQMSDGTMAHTVPDAGPADDPEGLIWLTIGLTPSQMTRLQAYAAAEERTPEAQGKVFILMAVKCWPQSTPAGTTTAQHPARVRPSRAKSANGGKA